jgi:hypothetical protein
MVAEVKHHVSTIFRGAIMGYVRATGLRGTTLGDLGMGDSEIL